MLQFEVIDRKTGKAPTDDVVIDIARLGGLIEMDIDGFYIDSESDLALVDECGNLTYVDSSRFVAVPKWIYVEDRLPESYEIECLVADADDNYGVGFYRDDAKAWDSPSWGWLERKDEVDNHEAYTMPCGIGKVVKWIPLLSKGEQ